MFEFYSLKIEDCFKKLKTSAEGLTAKEAQRRIKKYGLNKLPELKSLGKFNIFLNQFKSPLIYILMAAAFVVFAIGETVDGFIILFVLVFNAVVGTIQEGKSQNTLLALKKFTETNATALRDGKETIVPDIGLAPGDVIMLSEGERVPADARVIVSHTLKVDEAALTGESKPVHKISESLDSKKNISPLEQRNMVFKGTHIVAGGGKAVITATGLNTFIGKISKEIAIIDTEIPLKKNIHYLSRLVIATVVIISFAVFFLGVFFGKPAKEMLATVISLSVSIIPEGLPIVMTLVLATGVWRMSRHNALVKKLYAVEALGQAKIIAVDKTGTITKNELEVREIYVNGKIFEVMGSGYEPRGDIFLNEKVVAPKNFSEIILAGRIAAFCGSAHLLFSEETKEWRASGDPTEAALLVFAEKIGLKRDSLLSQHPLLKEFPFDYKKKYHTVINLIDGKKVVSVVGASEIVLSLSREVWDEGKIKPLTEEKRKNFESMFISMSERGLRVLAFAFAPAAPENFSAKEMPPLVFAGFYGLQDALRPEVKEAMTKAFAAGMRVVMITGDHKITARAVAREAGIYREGDKIITGEEMDGFSDESLARELPRTSVFARVTPEHKLRIIKAYKKSGEVIAMTGDGVNDAPSLVAADLGVAMGKIGTEVAKEAADIVLLDDNFGNIISAASEGRNIYKTIKKVILYLFSTSLGEVLTIVGAIFLGMPLPLLAAQIIWLNLITDGFLDVALAMETKEKGLLAGKFKKPAKYIVDSLMAGRMAVMALPMAAGALFLFQKYYGADIVKAWTISLTTLAVFQWFNAWNCRSENKSIFKQNPFANKFLVGATFMVVILQLTAIYAPFMQKILRTSPLKISEWLLIVSVAFSIILFEEARKLIYRRMEQNKKFAK